MNYFSIIIKTLMIISFIVITFLIYRFINANKKEKRISRFAINPINEKNISFIDKITNLYIKLINSISKYLEKKHLFTKYHLVYEKYLGLTDNNFTSYDYVSNKLILGFLSIIITIISDALRVKKVSFIQLLFAFLVGFFIIDIILMIRENRLKKQIENDLLKSVIIMNNAFKSGRSIIQAISLVAEELDGPLQKEYKKIYLDLSYGLDLEVVFKRFSDRVPYEEVKYISSSIVILNKTGGNVIKVFSSIEKNFINRKRMNDELNSTIAMSKFVSILLEIMPFAIVIIVYLFDKIINDRNYFEPLFTNSIGRLILLIIIMLYVLYIILVKKVTRLKE